MARSLVLPTKQADRIEKILDELQAKTNSTYVFLADISGQLISARGRTGSTNIVALAALTASNMSATAEMARQVGENNQFRLLFHEGEHTNIYLSYVGNSFLLAVVFSVGVQIGLVRLFSKRAVDALTDLAAEFEAGMRDTPSVMEAGFGTALDDALGRLMPGSS